MKTNSLKKKRGSSFNYSEEVKRIIEERAYYIWESKGRLNNSALDDWLQAEKELLKEGLIKRRCGYGRKKV